MGKLPRGKRGMRLHDEGGEEIELASESLAGVSKRDLLHQRVVLEGLTESPELNGKRGVLRFYDEQMGRLHVQLEDGLGMAALRSVH
eukprot:3392357-Prymnesium_polylepis.3